MQTKVFICVNNFMNAYSLYFKHLPNTNFSMNLNHRGVNSINLNHSGINSINIYKKKITST